MPKLLIYLLVAITGISAATATESNTPIKSLLLSKHDGTEIVLMLDETPTITFDKSMYDFSAWNAHIRTDGFVIDIAPSEIRSIIPSERVFSGINEILAPGNNGDVFLDYRGEDILIETSTEGITAEIYDFSGIRHLHRQLMPGTTVIRLNHLSKGYYIIKVGSQTLKINKL